MNQVDPEAIASLLPGRIEQADQSALSTYKATVEKAILGARTQAGRDAREGWRVREDLGPIACDGNPDTARVLLLKANPSYGDGATRESHFEPHPEWPLSVAGPHVTAATKAYYQNKVFGALRREGVTLQNISRRMMKVELCPWASKNWPTGQAELLQQLRLFPSRAPIFRLVSQLVEQGVLVLIARAEDEWFAGVPGMRDLLGTQVFVSRAKIAPSISERMYPGSWPRVLQALRS